MNAENAETALPLRFQRKLRGLHTSLQRNHSQMNKQRKTRTPADAEVFCTTREAAELLHVSLRTVQLWVEAGVLKAWKTDGGHRRLPLSSVQALIRERMGEAGVGSAPAVAEQPAADDTFSVLVLEDDDDMLHLYRLTMLGWNLPANFVFVKSVYEALVEIGRRPPDLLITDLRISGVDGFEIIRVLGADPALSTLNIVVVSGLDADEIAARGGLPPEITVFQKPLSFELLQGYVKACLAHKALQEKRHAR